MGYLSTRKLVRFSEAGHGRVLGHPANDGENVGLEQVLRVEGNIQEEPGRGRANQLHRAGMLCQLSIHYPQAH